MPEGGFVAFCRSIEHATCPEDSEGKFIRGHVQLCGYAATARTVVEEQPIWRRCGLVRAGMSCGLSRRRLSARAHHSCVMPAHGALHMCSRCVPHHFDGLTNSVGCSMSN